MAYRPLRSADLHAFSLDFFVGISYHPSTMLTKIPPKRGKKTRPKIRFVSAAARRIGNGQSKPPHAPIVVDRAISQETKLADDLVASVEKADPSDVTTLCDTYGLKRSDLGRLTGFSLRALAEWAAGSLPSEPARRRLHEVRRLLDALAEVVEVSAIATWLSQRNPALENMTPLQIIELGEVDRLWQMVYRLGSGYLD
jgi:DNA-binding transcriptional regulator YiaG